MCRGREVVLSVPPRYNAYLWSNGDISNSITVKETGTYSVTVTNFPDCSQTDNVEVEVKPCEPIESNVFSPNADGYNDEFFISFEGATPIDMDIYNRWGEFIRQLNGSNLKWDGKNEEGKNVPDGVYYYICHYINNFSERQTFKGFVELIR